MEFRDFVGYDARDQVKVTNRLEQAKFALHWQSSGLDVAMTDANQQRERIKRTWERTANRRGSTLGST